MRAWSRIRSSFRLTSAMLMTGLHAAWLSKDHPAPALGALAVVYVALALLIGPAGRALGLPAYRPDAAYSDTLQRWRQERRARRQVG